MENKKKIPKQKMQEFRDKMENFKYLRQQRASHYQGIYIALLVAAIVLLVDLVAGADIFFKVILIIGLIFIAEIFYKKMLSQTQKPIVCLENAMGTIEHGPHIVKDKKGIEWAVFSVSDFIHKDDKTKK
jgi:hypothetical protein